MNAHKRIVANVDHKTRFLMIFIPVCLSLLLVGCKKDPRVTFIQGSWYNLDKHLANIPGEDAQETSWFFQNGYFSTYGCCFVKVSYSGYYSVVDRSENELTLELFNLQGQLGDMVLHRDDTLSAILKLDTQADTLTINNGGPFARVVP